jgi:hypothetical protein
VRVHQNASVDNTSDMTSATPAAPSARGEARCGAGVGRQGSTGVLAVLLSRFFDMGPAASDPELFFATLMRASRASPPSVLGPS